MKKQDYKCTRKRGVTLDKSSDWKKNLL